MGVQNAQAAICAHRRRDPVDLETSGVLDAALDSIGHKEIEQRLAAFVTVSPKRV